MPAIIAAIVVSTAAGLWAEGRFGARAQLASRRSLLFVLYFVLPPVTFLNLTRADLDIDAGLGIGFAWLALAILGGLAWLVTSRLLRLPRRAVGAVISSVVVVNTGYLGYAVVAALVGFDGLDQAVAYDVLVSGPGLLLGAFGAAAAFGDSAGEGPRERAAAFVTRNPALWAALLAVVAPAALAPDALVDVSRVVIISVLPLGFFAVGVSLAQEAGTGTAALAPRLDAPVATAVALRLIGGPLLLLGLSAAVIDVPHTYLLLAAMPCGLNTMIVAHAYGLDLRIAAGAIAWSTAIFLAGLVVIELAP